MGALRGRTPLFLCIALALEVFSFVLLSIAGGGVAAPGLDGAPFIGIYAAIVVRDAVNYWMFSSDRTGDLLLQLAPSLISGTAIALSRCGARAVVCSVDVGRYLTWAISSPFMLHQLHIRSAASVPVPYAENFAMLACGLAADAAAQRPLLLLFVSSAGVYMWTSVARFIVDVYNAPCGNNDGLNVAQRNVVLLSWSTYPAVFLMQFAGLVPASAMSTVYRTCDVLSKVVSSSVVAGAEKNRSVRRLQMRSDLLEEVLPPPFIDDIIDKMPKTFVFHDTLVVMFSDIVEYTTMSSESRPKDVIVILTSVFEKFDAIASERGITKVETIGDAYMAVCVGNEAPSMVYAACDMIRTVRAVHRPVIRDKREKVLVVPKDKLRVRVGIHVGEAYSGVLSRLVPRYCYIGDTVNTASRMQSGGEQMRVHVSDAMKTLLESSPEASRFVYEAAGEKHYKGKGVMKTWFVDVVKYGSA